MALLFSGFILKVETKIITRKEASVNRVIPGLEKEEKWFYRNLADTVRTKILNFDVVKMPVMQLHHRHFYNIKPGS